MNMNILPEELIRKIYKKVYDFVLEELIQKYIEKEIKAHLINYNKECQNSGCYSTCSIDSDFCCECCENEYYNDYYYYQDLQYNSYYDADSQSFVHY